MKGFKRVVGWGAGLVVLGALIGGVHHTPTTTNLTSTPSNAVQGAQAESNSPASSPPPTQVSPPVQPTPTPTPSPTLSNNNTYTNADGDTIHSPAYSTDNSVPAGATAQCGDGTYSFSTHHSGTCSHHGGVARWL